MAVRLPTRKYMRAVWVSKMCLAPVRLACVFHVPGPPRGICGMWPSGFSRVKVRARRGYPTCVGLFVALCTCLHASRTHGDADIRTGALPRNRFSPKSFFRRLSVGKRRIQPKANQNPTNKFDFEATLGRVKEYQCHAAVGNPSACYSPGARPKTPHF